MKRSLKGLTLGALLSIGLMGGISASADVLYTVKSGDTLSQISHEFAGDNSLVDSIANENGIEDIHLIFEGQTLNIKTDLPSVEDFVSEVETIDNAEVYYEEAPVQEYVQEAPVQEAPQASYSGNSSSAKEWIAQKESGGSYSASNGYHVGRYQLDPNYLNGDHSPENQERVADQYVADRYGSWENAQSFWMSNGWY